MKRFLALAALVLGLASCQTEPEGLDVNVGGEQDVTISVSLPETTRANSEDGAFDNVDLSGDATIRYIMKIYDQNNRPSDVRYVKYSDGNTVTFDVRLVPNRAYNFVVWADIVDGEEDIDKHYNTADLTKVTLKDWNAMDETRDAFTGVEFIEKYNGASRIDVELTRPFAKLRVLTTDMADLRNLDITPAKGTVIYGTKHYTKFNALTGEAYELATENKTHNYDIQGYENGVLFVDYFFANDEVVQFYMDIMEADNARIKENNFNTDIPVKRNYLTTISGNILTDGNVVNVEVVENGAFANENEIPYELAMALANGGTAVLESDVVLTSKWLDITDKDVTIDLNGHNITKTAEEGKEWNLVFYVTGGKLTIKGEGNINVTGAHPYDMAIWAAAGEVNIEGGNFYGEGIEGEGCDLIYSTGGKVNISGGSFKQKYMTYGAFAEPQYALLNAHGNHAEYFSVTGGRFFGFDPANNYSEGAGTNFVVPGYNSKQEGDWYVVGVDTIDNAGEFTAALASANAGDTILLGEGVTIDGTFNFTNDQITIASIDANNPATIKGRININGQYANGVKFENVTFAVNDASKVLWTGNNGILTSKPSIFMSNSSSQNIVFNNCTFELTTSAYAYTCNAGGKTTFNECEFKGNFNYAMYVRANIEVTNCTYTTTATNVLAGACVNALANGKVVFTNNRCVAAGGNIGLSGAIVFASTNNNYGGTGWVGPVEFTVKDNTGFAYNYERFNDFIVDPNRHTFTEGSETFDF